MVSAINVFAVFELDGIRRRVRVHAFSDDWTALVLGKKGLERADVQKGFLCLEEQVLPPATHIRDPQKVSPPTTELEGVRS